MLPHITPEKDGLNCRLPRPAGRVARGEGECSQAYTNQWDDGPDGILQKVQGAVASGTTSKGKGI